MAGASDCADWFIFNPGLNADRSNSLVLQQPVGLVGLSQMVSQHWLPHTSAGATGKGVAATLDAPPSWKAG